MKITVQLSKRNAVKLGVEQWGNIEIDIDLSQLSEEEREWLAESQQTKDGWDMNVEYYEKGYMKFQLFAPTAEGVIESVRFKAQKFAEKRAYGEQERAERKAEEEKRAKEEAEREEAAIAYLLNLGATDEFVSKWAAAAGYLLVPGYEHTVKLSNILGDPRLEPQLEYRRRVLAERDRLEEERREQKQREKQARAEAKRQQVATWVQEHGTESQKRRHAVDLLDDQEVIDAMRDLAFSPLDPFKPYEKINSGDVEHEDNSGWGCDGDVEFGAENSCASEETFAQLEEMQKLLPDATITPRLHTATCNRCGSEATKPSLLAKITVGVFEFHRDYAVGVAIAKRDSIADLELTASEIGRQDAVDNAILEMLHRVTGGEIEWDIELMGGIRDAVQEVVVDKLHLMSEEEFYPFISEGA